jgi:hypothetical protein
MSILYAIIAALVGLLWYGNNKRKQAEALNDNEGTLKQLHPLDGELAKNQGKADAEKDLRDQKEQEMNNAKKDSDINNVIDFLNRINKK